MITQPSVPVLIDNFIIEFNSAIAQALPWLSNPLGKVQAVTKKHDKSFVTFPAMHQDSGEYIEVFPSDNLTNYSWFVVQPITLDGNKPKAKYNVQVEFNIFLDLSKVYPLVTQSRDLENAKQEAINALYSLSLKSAAVRPLTVSEDYSDVYSGYSLSRVADKYFMQPYAGLNFQLDTWVRNTGLICGA